MLAYRLVRLIETHSDALASGLQRKVEESEFTRDFRNVPAEELRQRVYEIYRHLGEWLLGKTEAALAKPATPNVTTVSKPSGSSRSTSLRLLASQPRTRIALPLGARRLGGTAIFNSPRR